RIDTDAVPGGVAAVGIRGADARHGRAAPVRERGTGRADWVIARRAVRHGLDLLDTDVVPGVVAAVGIHGADARHHRAAPVRDRGARGADRVEAASLGAVRLGLGLGDAVAVPGSVAAAGIRVADARHDRAAPVRERGARGADLVAASACLAVGHALNLG